MRQCCRILSVTGLLLPAFGQITITQGDIAPVGTSYAVSSVTDVAVDLGSGGANQTWTIPDHPWEQSIESWVDPATTQYADSFPNATHCIIESPDSGYVYFRLAADGIFLHGVVMTEDDQLMFIAFDQEAMFLPLPLSYPASWTTIRRFTFEPEPGIWITVVDSVVQSVDGWGTLDTPFGSWPVLRIQAHEFMIRSMPGWPVDTTESYSYSWLSENAPIGAEILSNEGEQNPNFTQGEIVITTGGTAADPQANPIARHYALDQNYPNPFNPETQISFNLPASGDVTLKVYNLLGEEVATLMNGFRPSGRNNVAFKAAGLSSGTYIYRLQTNGFADEKRMILLR